MNVSEPAVGIALDWLCILVYACVAYYWSVVPQYERNVRHT